MKNNGFTLLEVIIYLSLFSLLMTGILQTVFIVFETVETNQEKIAVLAESTFLQQKMTWALSGATNVGVVSSTTIVIVRPDLGSESPLTLQADNGTWSIKRGTADMAMLTSAEISVSDVVMSLGTSTLGAGLFLKITYRLNDTPILFETVLSYE